MMNRWRYWLGWAPLSVLVVCAIHLCATQICAELQANSKMDTLVKLNGQSVSAKIEQIDAKGRLSGTGLDAALRLTDLRKFTRDVPKLDSHAALRVDLVGGGHIWCSDLTLSEDEFQITWRQGQTIKLPIEAIRAVRLKPKQEDAGFEAALLKPSDEHDLIFVQLEDRFAQFKGLMESINPTQLAYSWDDKDQTVAREKLYGVAVASIGRAPDLTGHSRIELSDGSSLWGDVKSLQDDVLLFKPLAAAEVKIPWPSVCGLTIRSNRMVFVSDLKPIEVDEEPLLTKPRSWQKDLNVSGKPIVVAEKSYRKGIGVASRSRLVFSPAGKYETFAAVLGIDDETRGRGDCEFIVLGDGRELLRERIRGNQKPGGKAVEIDIDGVQKLTLLVEPGQGLDLADHANWCDARLLRPAAE
jgi:hypothetical protein